jgi:hypothetical protein
MPTASLILYVCFGEIQDSQPNAKSKSPLILCGYRAMVPKTLSILRQSPYSRGYDSFSCPRKGTLKNTAILALKYCIYPMGVYGQILEDLPKGARL